MEIIKSVKYIVISLLLILASVNFIKTTLIAIENSKRFEELENEILLLENEKKALEEENKRMLADEHIEEIARNSLNMGLPGEEVYVLGDKISANLKIENNRENTVITGKNESVVNKMKENALLWVALFF
jgi:cell division protein FtsB